MTDDNTRSERPDDVDDEVSDDADEKTRVVDRSLDDDHAHIVSRAPAEEHTRVVERKPLAAPVAAVVAAADANAADDSDAADDADAADDETRIASSTARPEGSGRNAGATADQPGMPDRFQPPKVQSGATESYGIRHVPPAAAPSSRPGLAPAPTVTLPASPAELREAAAARRRRRRWRTLAVAVASTLLVAAAAILGIVVLIGV